MKIAGQSFLKVIIIALVDIPTMIPVNNIPMKLIITLINLPTWVCGTISPYPTVNPVINEK